LQLATNDFPITLNTNEESHAEPDAGSRKLATENTDSQSSQPPKVPRFFFHIGYNGTPYNGWQKLPHNNSVQFIIERELSRVVKTPVTIVGCGRTDARVHASQYFFHADLEIPSVSELIFRLNKNLPNDIAVFDILPVQNHQHARLDAIKRTYTYFIHRSKDPFLNSVSSLYQERDLDLQKMKDAASLLMAYNDYRYFHRTASKSRTTRCTVSEGSLFVDEHNDRIKFTISANRFLRGMVRIIVHKLLEVGRKKITVEQFENYLMGTEIPTDIKPAHPQGLYLTNVKYPFLDLPPSSKFDLLSRSDGWKAV
jgi:tRNA pseudouridine38-40 synthase